jgi:hypothetical protein
MEAIAYIPGMSAFLYDTEYHEDYGSAPINRVVCLSGRSPGS